MPSTYLRTQDGRLVGKLVGTVLYKHVKPSKHLFKSIGTNGSWGIDYDVLFTKMPDRSSVRIYDGENDVIYTCTTAKWRELGEIKHFKQKTQDHYVQVFLPVEYFDKAKTHGVY